MKRILRLLAAVLLTAGCFAACSSPATDEQPNAAEADAGDDTDTGEPDATDPDDADGGEEDADTNGNNVCEPDCSGLQCGEDPQCGESCGECDGIDVCDDGQCVEADTHATWELDGEVVYQSTTVSVKRYNVSEDSARVDIREPDMPVVSLRLADVSDHETLTLDCDNYDWQEFNANLRLSFVTVSPDAFPVEWHGESFMYNSCLRSVEDGNDEATEWELHVSELTSEKLAGHFSMELLGAGPREGSTLEVYGHVDQKLTEQ